MSETLIISPPEAPTLQRVYPVKEEVVNNHGEVRTRQIMQTFPITIKGNVMYLVRRGGIGNEVRKLTDEEVREFLELSGDEINV